MPRHASHVAYATLCTPPIAAAHVAALGASSVPRVAHAAHCTRARRALRVLPHLYCAARLRASSAAALERCRARAKRNSFRFVPRLPTAHCDVCRARAATLSVTARRRASTDRCPPGAHPVPTRCPPRRAGTHEDGRPLPARAARRHEHRVAAQPHLVRAHTGHTAAPRAAPARAAAHRAAQPRAPTHRAAQPRARPPTAPPNHA
eukprot:3401663-Prymnesium_polylepis.3